MKFSPQPWVESQKIFQKKQKNLSRMSINQSINQNNKHSLLSLLKTNSFYQTPSLISLNILALTYSQIGKFMIQSQILVDNKCFRSMFLNENLFDSTPAIVNTNLENKESIYYNLYSSSFDFKNRLTDLLSHRIGEFFIFNNSYRMKNTNAIVNTNFQFETSILNKKQQIDSTKTTSLKSVLTNPGIYRGLWNFSLPEQSVKELDFAQSTNQSYNQFWSSATSFVFSFVQKRFLCSKHLLASKSLYFQDSSILKEPPSPPASFILTPARKFENFKRSERDSQQKNTYSILEKIQIHQQQRFMKNLYQKPVISLFHSEMVENRQTSFSSSVKELGYYDSFMKKPSSVNCYYKNRILTRQRFSVVNQWWSGHLAEHNLEKTFSSDVDWRSMFVESFGDLVIDFPDADQYYNPKLRRWFLQSTYGGYWHTFEKIIPYEIYYHFMILCFNKAFNYLNTEREILDDFVYTYLQKGFLKEIDLISNLSKFNLYSKTK
jgi:hypothetical protein